MSWLLRARRATPGPRGSWLIVAALLVLLGVLAMLQYVWQGELSKAQRVQMLALLESAAADFAEDFNRELTRAFLHFEPVSRPGAESSSDLGADYAALWEQWRASAPYPGLVGEILRLERGEDSFVLERLEPSTQRFEPMEWPSELDPLRGRLERGPAEGPPGPSFLLMPEVPAVLIPHFGGRGAGGPPDRRGRRPPEPQAAGLVVVRLDLDYLRQTFLPQLGAKHLTGSRRDRPRQADSDGLDGEGLGGDGLEYRFAVRLAGRDEQSDAIGAAESGRFIYRSDAQLPPERYLAGDWEVALFDFLPGDALRRLWLEVRLARPEGDWPDPEAMRRMFRPGSRQTGPRGGGRFLSMLLGARVATGLRGGPAAAESGAWRLVIQHPEGSLEAALTRSRRRNLAVSSGILLLLGLTVAMLMRSRRRARELASQQVEFVAGITHELRTPLAAIRSLAQNLADGIVRDPDQSRRYGALIEGEGARLSAMVEQVLELAGILSQKRAYSYETVAVADVVEAAAADCTSLLSESDVRLDLDVAADLPPILADRAALRRALGNLIANAVKYGGDEPWVGLRAGAENGLGGARPREVSIRVADRGPGIAREDLPRLFEPFYRGRDAMAAQIQGSGLGLSLVKHTVEAHGGRIEVESTAGEGSTFIVCLPALVVGEERSEPEDPAG